MNSQISKSTDNLNTSMAI